MVREALKNLTPEQLETYQKIGKEMYESVDFEQNKVLNNLPAPVLESAAYIKDGLRSGLHPSDLTKKEVEVLTEVYGKEWYKHFDYTAEEVGVQAELGIQIQR